MNPLNRLRIAQRLSLGFGLTLALLLALVAVALLQVRSLNADLMRYDVKVVPAVKTIHTVLELIGAARRHETQHLLTADAAGFADLEQKLGRDRSAVAANLQAYRNLIADDEDRADYEKLQSLADRYWQQQDQVLALSRNKASDPARGAAAVKLLLTDSRLAY